MKTVFVVDDSDTNLAMAEGTLEEDYRVLTIPSADKMFSLLEKIKPDLILLDIEMPVMNGFEALKKLKSINDFSGIPVLFLTGTINASIQEKSMQFGAVGIIAKPFSSLELLNTVKSYIG